VTVPAADPTSVMYRTAGLPKAIEVCYGSALKRRGHLQRRSKALTRMRSLTGCPRSLLSIAGTVCRFNRWFFRLFGDELSRSRRASSRWLDREPTIPFCTATLEEEPSHEQAAVLPPPPAARYVNHISLRQRRGIPARSASIAATPEPPPTFPGARSPSP
jgi:hypothetical protein